MLLRRTLRKRPGRTLLLVTAVAVAVALLVSLQSLAAGFLAAQTAEIRERSVDVVMQPLATRGDPRLTGLRPAGALDAHALAARVAAVDGVASASPVLEEVLVVGAPGQENVSQVLAQGVIPADHLDGLGKSQREKFHGYFSRAEDLHYGNGTYDGPASGEVVVNDVLAEALGVGAGDRLSFSLSATDPMVSFVVAGTFDTPFTGTGSLGSVQVALFPLSELQVLAGHADRDAATRLALRLDPDVREDPAQTRALLERLQENHEGYQFLTKEDELREARERAAVSAGFYTAVAYVSLVVSALLVVSVMVMEVQQRRRDLGILRAVGWTRGSLFRTVAGEAVVLVGVGTVAGILLGFFGSEVLGEYFRRGYGLDVGFTRFTPELALLSLVQAMVVGVLAALYPAWLASRVDALSVLRSAR